MTSKEQLQQEKKTYDDQASQHAKAAENAKNQVSTLDKQISAANAAIAVATSFRDTTAGGFETQNNTLTSDLQALGTQVGNGIGDAAASSNITSINSGNAGKIQDIKDQCSAIIARLQGDVDTWTAQRKTASQTESTENAAAQQNSKLSKQVQGEIDAS